MGRPPIRKNRPFSNAERQRRYRLARKRDRRTTGWEWYTAPERIEMARAVLGGIDLDPASCNLAQKVVRARTYFNKTDDGLSKQWHGRVWLNPPFQDVGRFVHKLVSETAAGRVRAAILLSPDATDTAWYHAAIKGCAAVCLPRGRLKFYNPEKVEGAGGGKRGHSIFYFGSDPRAFYDVFHTVGLITEANVIAPTRRAKVKRGPVKRGRPRLPSR